jgi:hypothetical protein
MNTGAAGRVAATTLARKIRRSPARSNEPKRKPQHAKRSRRWKMNTATMKYDVQTAGVRISFLVVDGEMSLEMPGGSFDDQDKTEPGVCRFPQTPANLRRLANMLNAMADFHERDGK